MWQYINSKIGKQDKIKRDIEYLICNEEIISDHQAMADEFVNFFTNIGVNLAIPRGF